MKKTYNIKSFLEFYSRSKTIKHITALLITLLIAVLSLANFKKENIFEEKIPHLDKFVHFIMYFFYTLILNINNNTSNRKIKGYKVALYCIIFGMLIEYLQYSIFTYRSGDIVDLLFNIAGVFSASVTFKKIKLLQR
jgi:VanZ family protein